MQKLLCEYTLAESDRQTDRRTDAVVGNVPPMIFRDLSSSSCFCRHLKTELFSQRRRSLSTVGGTHSGQSTPHYCPPLMWCAVKTYSVVGWSSKG